MQDRSGEGLAAGNDLEREAAGISRPPGSRGRRLTGMTPARARLLLGVERTASLAEVEAAFRRRVWSAHPDRGGSGTEFADLAAARAVLRDRFADPGPAGPPTRSAVAVVPDATMVLHLVAGALGRWVGRRTAGRSAGFRQAVVGRIVPGASPSRRRVN